MDFKKSIFYCETKILMTPTKNELRDVRSVGGIIPQAKLSGAKKSFCRFGLAAGTVVFWSRKHLCSSFRTSKD